MTSNNRIELNIVILNGNHCLWLAVENSIKSLQEKNPLEILSKV